MLSTDGRSAKYFKDFSNLKTRKQRNKVRKRIDKYREESMRLAMEEVDRMIKKTGILRHDFIPADSMDDINEYEVVME